MKITIENTSKIVELDGVPARVWVGETDTGIPVHVFITRMSPQTHDESALEQFGRELRETRTPTAAIGAYPLRLIL